MKQKPAIVYAMRFVCTLGFVGVLAATALPLGVRQAHACSCLIPDTEEEVRGAFEHYDLVVMGSVASPGPSVAFPDRVKVIVERTFKGTSVAELALNQTNQEAERRRQSHIRQGYANLVDDLDPDCSYYVIGQPGERYLLFLRSQPDGTYVPGGCSSVSLRIVETSEPHQRFFELVQAIGNAPQQLPATGTGGVSTSGHGWPAWLIAAVVGVGGSLVFMAGAVAAKVGGIRS